MLVLQCFMLEGLALTHLLLATLVAGSLDAGLTLLVVAMLVVVVAAGTAL